MRYINFFIFILFSLCAFSQASTYKIEKKVSQEKSVIAPYDSVQNITRANFSSLVGQKLQIIPTGFSKYVTLYRKRPEGLITSDFKLSPKGGTIDNEVFDIVGTDSICDASLPSSRRTTFFLIVQNENYKTPVYLKVCDTSDDYLSGQLYKAGWFSPNNSLLICGYFEKLRQTTIGSKLVNQFPDNKDIFSLSDRYIVYNLEDGEPISSIPEDFVWEVKDLALIENDGRTNLSYILTSDKFPNAFASFVDKSKFTPYEKFIADKTKRKQWEASIVRKYGKTNGQLIIEGKVKIGFTKAMCEEAWGKPRSINKTTGSWGTHEQWVYGSGNYLYFSGNKLTSIQN